MSRGIIAQVLAAGSVALSLAFVGYEIRQNTKVARQDAYLSFTQEMNALSYSITNDAELAEIMARVQAGAPIDQFSDVEQLRVTMSFINLLRVWEGLYRSRAEGIADDTYFTGLEGGMGPYRTSFFEASWPTLRATVTEDFAQFFESRIWGGNPPE